MEIPDLTQTALGIELGSTNIKAVLLDDQYRILARGSHTWENQLDGGIWTYSMEAVRDGLRACYARLAADYAAAFGQPLYTVGVIGISGMMHGYLALDADDRLLVPFRTWRNTITSEAAEKLTSLFGFNIPQRWSIAHLYQAMLRGEAHLPRLARLTTLAGYVHHALTGQYVLGVGEASGVFPIDSAALDYDARMAAQFDRIIAEMGYPWKLRQLLPPVLSAGEAAGRLTEAGARLLDPSGMLQAGIPFVPPEGDAGTGMAATNAVRPGIGNVSAGTSAFAMIVADRPLGVHREIDMVTTPTGRPVAMVHCNNCTSDINAWVGLFADFLRTAGFTFSDDALYRLLFDAALDGDADCGGMMAYNYFSGEGIMNTDQGTPVFLRRPDCRLTLGSFMQTHLFSAVATLKIGLDILMQKECLPLNRLYAHGGFFRVPEVGQRILSAAAGVPVTVMETAGSGGPYGMALLAAYGLQRTPGETLEDYLDGRVFANTAAVTRMAGEEDIQRFNRFVSAYRNAFDIEMAAIQQMKRGAF